MALIAGLAVGLWLVLPDVQAQNDRPMGTFGNVPLLVVVSILGGLSLVGPPILLIGGRHGRPWGAGKILWFSEGMASWLLWPPIVVARVQGRSMGDTISGPCFAYGTPLMAIYTTAALLAGGWIRPGRRRIRRSQLERFGLLLAMLWACTGLYVLYLLYASDIFGRK